MNCARLARGRNANPPHAQPIHLDDGEFPSSEHDALSGSGNVSQSHQHKASQSLYASIPRKRPLHLRLEVAQGHATVQHEGAACSREQRSSPVIELIFQLSRQLLQCIFGGHETHCGAVLIDHNRNLSPAPLKLLHEIQHGLGLGHHERVSHHLP